jgi:hypothetical protein
MNADSLEVRQMSPPIYTKSMGAVRQRQSEYGISVKTDCYTELNSIK